MIIDNGQGMMKDTIQTSLAHKGQMNKVGLKNVDERLKLIYGEAYGLYIESEADQGTKITLRMKILE